VGEKESDYAASKKTSKRVDSDISFKRASSGPGAVVAQSQDHRETGQAECALLAGW